MSTIAPDESRGITTPLIAQGIDMLDAPVIGSTILAQEGTLGIKVGGDQKVYKTHQDLLGGMSKDCYYLGSQGNGAQMKLRLD